MRSRQIFLALAVMNVELHDILGQPSRIEGLLKPGHVSEPRRDFFGTIHGGKHEGYALPLQLVGNVKCIVSL
jgi:hypothetical protein